MQRELVGKEKVPGQVFSEEDCKTMYFFKITTSKSHILVSTAEDAIYWQNGIMKVFQLVDQEMESSILKAEKALKHSYVLPTQSQIADNVKAYSEDLQKLTQDLENINSLTETPKSAPSFKEKLLETEQKLDYLIDQFALIDTTWDPLISDMRSAPKVHNIVNELEDSLHTMEGKLEEGMIHPCHNQPPRLLIPELSSRLDKLRHTSEKKLQLIEKSKLSQSRRDKSVGGAEAKLLLYRQTICCLSLLTFLLYLFL
eukprot:TRINITY_DN6542_c0_g1_i2.p1 TRINITY_DN6542_c0_g1~~TRINITY_DN6542_c0_g1_i2.p1  ORF type:complete len:256 (-),score=40.65 TRINITY_DN6542_c0_g1_i2:44-811(-)